MQNILQLTLWDVEFYANSLLSLNRKHQNHLLLTSLIAEAITNIIIIIISC